MLRRVSVTTSRVSSLLSIDVSDERNNGRISLKIGCIFTSCGQQITDNVTS